MTTLSTCPTCGGPVRVVSSGEDTSYYEPTGLDLDDPATVERVARGFHGTRILFLAHGKFTDRCICNDRARDLLAALREGAPK